MREGQIVARTERDSEALLDLRERTRSILDQVIGKAQDVAILDAPNQRNVGDSLIWEGELAYLRSMGKRIRYVSDLNGFDAQALRHSLPRGGVVLLHGGGNFGDLWLGHQAHRERLVSELTDFKIVQLSQSIYFADAKRAEEANRILSSHADFTVLIRDTLSLKRASEQLPNLDVVFCPDMAFGYEPTVEREGNSDGRNVLVIARADRESASGLREVPAEWIQGANLQVTDWGLHAKDSTRWKFARRVAWLQHKLSGARRKLSVPVPALPQRVVQAAITEINRSNVASAVSLYGTADVIVVDRLHAHVLAALLGIPHVLLDNNYRKLGGVYDDYSGTFGTAAYCTDLADAKSRVQSILETR